jgi:hypothetical protein
VWRSLKTLDRAEARVKSDRWRSEGHSLFLTLKRHGAGVTRDQIDELVERWLESELDEAEDLRVLAGPFPDSYRDDVSMVLTGQLEDTYETLVSCDFKKVEQEAAALLKATGLSDLDRDSEEFGPLCRKLLQAKEHCPRTEIGK